MSESEEVTSFHLKLSGPSLRSSSALTNRYIAPHRSIEDVDYFVSEMVHSDSGMSLVPRLRVKGEVTDLWVSPSGWTYFADASRKTITRYRDLGAPELVSTSETFDVPFFPDGLWGTSDTQVYCWGTTLIDGSDDKRPWLARLDGDTFRELPAPPFPLRELHGCDDQTIYGAGARGVARFDGSAWQVVPVPGGESIMSVFVASPSEVYAAGYGGTLFEGGGAGLGPVASLPGNPPMFAVAKFQDQVVVGFGPGGFFRRVGNTSDLENIRKFGAYAFDSREDLLIAIGTMVASTDNLVDFTGYASNFSEMTATVAPDAP